ncbi:MAG: hypothetical protein H6974_10960 [Gammaproteobacteria bacterium]|nr:hypothetical protein [Gammaproteobacteria bacterium]
MNDDTKHCADCRHARREQTGPHEYLHTCALQQRDFPDAAHCAAYHPGETGQLENEYWPFRQPDRTGERRCRS